MGERNQRPKARRSLKPLFDKTSLEYGFEGLNATMLTSKPYFTRSCKNEPNFVHPSLHPKYCSSNCIIQPSSSLDLHASLSKKSKIPFDQSSTSDYGTSSEASYNCTRKSSFVPEFCSSFTAMPPAVQALPLECDMGVLSDLESDCPLLHTAWDSDDESRSDEWESAADVHYFTQLRNNTGAHLCIYEDIKILIPKDNASGFLPSDYGCQILTDEMYYPVQSSHLRHISPVVLLEPHGVKFHDDLPALIFLPVYVEPSVDSTIICLCSNTSEGEAPQWERVNPVSYTYKEGRLVITANHFSLFTAILEEPCPEVAKQVRCRAGGIVKVHEVPGVEVTFPRGCLDENIYSVIKVFYTSEPGIYINSNESFASPVIMVGPHGYQFGDTKQPVIIQLPVPHYYEILQRFGPQTKLSVWQSSNSEHEPLIWEPLHVELTMRVLRSGLVVVSFPVTHFSFFKIIWDVLSNSLYEAKMGMSYFYSHISFSMMCQAFMGENTANNRFGLEVVCYRSDKKFTEVWETTNYKHRVGSSLKPKLIKPGRILIRLKSQLFESDIDAGEEPEMVKEEPDFRGRDFEKQYACRFKEDSNVDRGTFGKVVVERVLTAGSNEPIFEFNLHKKGCEDETSPDLTDRWSIVAIKELAGTLSILHEKNWKRLAQYVGFTNSEIKSKLQYSADPFVTMVNLYSARQGTPEEFVGALYAVSRELHVANNTTPNSRNSGSSSGHASGSSRTSSGNKSPGWKWQDLGKWRGNKNGSDSGTASQAPSLKRKRSNTASGGKNTSGGSSAAKRHRTRKVSESSETGSAHSDEGDDEREEEDADNKEQKKAGSSMRYRKDPSRLSDANLWEISAFLDTDKWIALGRSLGLEECVLRNTDASHNRSGFRECSYQMLLEWKGRQPKSCTFGRLFTCLEKEKLNRAAKELTSMKFHKKALD